jgi:SAM-dependent methyltransferase
MIRSWLAHPLTRGLDIDAPETTALRRRILREKRFLRRLYLEWYGEIVSTLPSGEGRVVELGSGAGFLADLLPELVTSDIQTVPGIDLVANATALPFAERSLRGIVMTNLLHHLDDPRRFLLEAARCVRAGGVLSMIEPWVTPWSSFVYRRLHHEPFDPDAREWSERRSGPLSGANGALPWILLHRDREPELVRPTTPFRYLVSGGVSLRSLAPGWSFGLWTALERTLRPLSGSTAMFVHAVLRRSSEP